MATKTEKNRNRKSHVNNCPDALKPKDKEQNWISDSKSLRRKGKKLLFGGRK